MRIECRLICRKRGEGSEQDDAVGGRKRGLPPRTTRGDGIKGKTLGGGDTYKNKDDKDDITYGGHNYPRRQPERKALPGHGEGRERVEVEKRKCSVIIYDKWLMRRRCVPTTIRSAQVRSPAPPLEQKTIIAFANDPWTTTLNNPPLCQRFGPLGPLPATRAADGLPRTLGVPPRVVKFHELIHQRPPERRTREDHRVLFIQKNPTPSVGYARRTGRGHNHQRHRISSHLSMDTT